MASCHIKTLNRSAGTIHESDRGCSAQDAWYILAISQVKIDFRGILCRFTLNFETLALGILKGNNTRGVNDMSQDNELRRLEQFVEKLLARFSELRAEKAKLLQELRERELQVEDLRSNLSSKDVERNEISQRVSKIVEQIEEWETGLELVADVAVRPEAIVDSGVASEAEAHDFPAKKIVEEQKGEEEVRVQQNLFSIGNTHR